MKVFAARISRSVTEAMRPCWMMMRPDRRNMTRKKTDSLLMNPSLSLRAYPTAANDSMIPATAPVKNRGNQEEPALEAFISEAASVSVASEVIYQILSSNAIIRHEGYSSHKQEDLMRTSKKAAAISSGVVAFLSLSSLAAWMVMKEAGLQLKDVFGRRIEEDESTPLIKGSSSGVYHVPGSRYYDRTNAVSLFPNVESAEAAGFRAPSR